jgi:transposase-like protein
MTTLTMQDEKRIEIIQRVFRGELTVLRAAVILGISERQCYRIKRRVHQEGLKGVIHGNRAALVSARSGRRLFGGWWN